MKLEVLVSTMHQKDYELLDIMKIQSDVVVVNQCDREQRTEFQYKNFNVLWIDTLERGLSNSRNMAIDNSKADICILADDDEELRDNYPEIIKKAFAVNEKYEILRFKIHGIEKSFKEYPAKAHKIGFLKSLKVSSVEIAFKRKEVLKYHIKFDELIGAGTEFLMGEENSFLFQCLKKGLKMKYIPENIAKLHIGDSTWFTGFNEKYFVGRGAAFTSMSKWFAPILILQFAIRKRKLYEKQIPLYKSIKYMLQGKKEYTRIRFRKCCHKKENKDIS